MALQQLEFTFEPQENYTSIPKDWSHTGVVGSGDMEALLTYKDQKGKTTVKVVTPVTGFDHVWKMVLQRFVQEQNTGNLHIEINDNNSTPFIVATRLKQAMIEAKGGVN